MSRKEVELGRLRVSRSAPTVYKTISVRWGTQMGDVSQIIVRRTGNSITLIGKVESLGLEAATALRDSLTEVIEWSDSDDPETLRETLERVRRVPRYQMGPINGSRVVDANDLDEALEQP